jgi:hypothetical protein
MVKVEQLSIPSEMRKYTSSQYNPLLTAESGDREITFVPSTSQVMPILINVDRYPPTDKLLSGRGIKWEAWQLGSGSQPASFLTSGSFLADYFNRRFSPKRVEDLAINPRLPPGAITMIGSNKLILNVDRNSIYLVNLRDNSTRIVFHPGSDTITVRTKGEDLVALFARNGYRVFLLRLTAAGH